MKLTASLEADDAFLRELHHRLRNTFQMSTSLISLQARTVPEDQRGELRFVEEHVQAMAAAYRIVRVTDRKVEVVLADLVTDVVDSLRQIAGQPRDLVQLKSATDSCVVRIDQAIAMGLYLATLIPPYLDCAARHDRQLELTLIALDAEWMRLSLTYGGPTDQVRPSVLRQRLAKVYLGRLGAQIEMPAEPDMAHIRIHVPPRE